MKIVVIMTVARQIMGEYVCIRAEKGFIKKDDTIPQEAKDYLENLKKTFTTPDGKAQSITVSTEMGKLDCMCEAGVFELEVE